MSINKVSMSLDDIIKANKNKANTNIVRGGTANRNRKNLQRSSGVLKRGNRIGNGKFQQRNNTSIQKKGNNSVAKRNNNKQNLNTIATQKLVQKLVKKALAQTNVRKARPQSIIHKKRGAAVRYVKKTVVLNRVNQRSRVITRNPRVITQSPRLFKGRGIVRYAEEQDFLPAVRRVKYQIASPVVMKRQPINKRVRKIVRRQQQVVLAPVQYQQVQRRPVFVQQQRSRPVVIQQQNPIFRGNNQRPGSVRAQIAALRQRQPQVIYVQKQSRPNVPIVSQRVQQQPRNFQKSYQQRNPRFQQQRVQIQRDPFYEPPNYLQRL